MFGEYCSRYDLKPVVSLRERDVKNVEKILLLLLLLLLLLFISTANGSLPGGSGTTIRHNTQNNTPRSNKTQHTKLHKQ
jgi:hypothetical protein